MRELMPVGRVLASEAVADKSLSRGEWRCSVTMAAEDKLDASLTAITLPEQVSIVVYGSRGAQGPLRLQDTNRDSDLFLLGQTDTFEELMLGDIGDIRKLRVCAGREDDDNPVWMVDHVTLEDVHSHEVVCFDFSRWVGQVGGDIQHELPVLLPGEMTPAVLQYEVRVQTESTRKAGTNAAVFINLYGKQGDSGRRRLVKPAHGKSPFQTGQTDVFIIEAVDLGDLEKVVVTKGPGKPWQLGQVKVRPGLFSSLSHVFIWSNPVGDDADKMREVDVTIPVISSWPAPVAIPAQQVDDLPTSAGQWSVKVVTRNQGVSGEGTDLVVVMCGDKGESSPIRFHSTRDRPFQPRHTDTAEVHLAQDVGDLIKVRLGFADNSKNKALDIAKLRFEDVDTRDNFSYELQSQVEVTESSDGWTEFPVIWPAVHILPVVKYQVEVTTGSVPNGDTKAQVYIQLHGRMGSTGRRQLKKSLNNDTMFQLNQTDRFELEAVSLMSVDKVVIGHYSATAGDGWFLKRVVVTPQGEEECVFECNRWLDGGEDDGRIERTLNPLVSSARDPSPVASRPAQKTYKWNVWTTTGSEPNQGTSSPVVLILYGDKGHTEPLLIGDTSQLTFRFTEGETQDFEIETDVDVGKVYKVRVGFPGEGKELMWYSDFVESPTWYLERLKVQEVSSGKQYMFKAKKWLHVDEHNDHWREFPVYLREEEDMLPVHDYYVEVFTGDKFGAGTDANVYIQIFGERGDTGKRHLHGTRTEGRMFERSMHDVFLLEAVDLGNLSKVNISHDGLGAGSGWYLDRITIKESESGKEKFAFNCERWLDVDEDDGAIERELPLASVVHDEPEGPRLHDYYVEVFTGDKFGAGTDANVYLQIFGERGDTGKRHLHGTRTEGRMFERSMHDVFLLEAVDLGNLSKVNISHDGLGVGSGWYLDRITIKESESGKEKFVFNCERWLDVDEDDGAIERELPLASVVRDEPEGPRPGDWQVLIMTSIAEESGTDIRVTLTVFGDKGNSGALPLGSPNDGCFQTGHTDQFDIFLDPKEMGKIEKIRLEHDNSGLTAGWHVEKMIMSNEYSGDKLEFIVDRCLSFSEKHGDIVFEAAAEWPDEQPLPKYKYLVKTVTPGDSDAGTNADVYLTLVGSRGDSGRRELRQNLEEGSNFQTGSTDSFIIEAVDLGRLEKVIIGLNGAGFGSSWKLQCVVVRVSEKESFVFPWGKYLNEENPEAEIALAEVVDDYTDAEIAGLTPRDGQ